MELRRAIEIVMSRLAMPGNLSSMLSMHLRTAIEKGDDLEEYDADALRACLIEIMDCADVDISFPKDAMIGRFMSIRQAARSAITPTHNS